MSLIRRLAVEAPRSILRWGTEKGLEALFIGGLGGLGGTGLSLAIAPLHWPLAAILAGVVTLSGLLIWWDWLRERKEGEKSARGAWCDCWSWRTTSGALGCGKVWK